MKVYTVQEDEGFYAGAIVGVYATFESAVQSIAERGAEAEAERHSPPRYDYDWFVKFYTEWYHNPYETREKYRYVADYAITEWEVSE